MTIGCLLSVPVQRQFDVLFAHPRQNDGIDQFQGDQGAGTAAYGLAAIEAGVDKAVEQTGPGGVAAVHRAPVGLGLAGGGAVLDNVRDRPIVETKAENLRYMDIGVDFVLKENSAFVAGELAVVEAVADCAELHIGQGAVGKFDIGDGGIPYCRSWQIRIRVGRPASTKGPGRGWSGSSVRRRRRGAKCSARYRVGNRLRAGFPTTARKRAAAVPVGAATA